MFKTRAMVPAGLGAMAAGWVLLTPAQARAEDDPKAQCASSYETAQETRADGRLVEAREALVVCAQSFCPAFVQTDCAQWLTEVEKDIPSVVVAAEGPDGQDTESVKVLVDGEVKKEQLDGKGFALNPGLHLFRFEMEGVEPIEKKIVIRQGDKNREISISFVPGAGVKQADKAEPEQDQPTEAADSGKPGSLRTVAYIAGGVGIAGIGTGVVFGLMGNSKKNELLNSECAKTKTCSQSSIDSVQTKLLIANIGFGVGAAGLIAGGVLFVISIPKKPAPASNEAASLHLDVLPTPGGAFASASGNF